MFIIPFSGNTKTDSPPFKSLVRGACRERSALVVLVLATILCLGLGFGVGLGFWSEQVFYHQQGLNASLRGTVYLGRLKPPQLYDIIFESML